MMVQSKKELREPVVVLRRLKVDLPVLEQALSRPRTLRCSSARLGCNVAIGRMSLEAADVQNVQPSHCKELFFSDLELTSKSNVKHLSSKHQGHVTPLKRDLLKRQNEHSRTPRTSCSMLSPLIPKRRISELLPQLSAFNFCEDVTTDSCDSGRSSNMEGEADKDSESSADILRIDITSPLGLRIANILSNFRLPAKTVTNQSIDPFCNQCVTEKPLRLRSATGLRMPWPLRYRKRQCHRHLDRFYCMSKWDRSERRRVLHSQLGTRSQCLLRSLRPCSVSLKRLPATWFKSCCVFNDYVAPSGLGHDMFLSEEVIDVCTIDANPPSPASDSGIISWLTPILDVTEDAPHNKESVHSVATSSVLLDADCISVTSHDCRISEATDSVCRDSFGAAKWEDFPLDMICVDLRLQDQPAVIDLTVLDSDDDLSDSSDIIPPLNGNGTQLSEIWLPPEGISTDHSRRYSTCHGIDSQLSFDGSGSKLMMFNPVQELLTCSMNCVTIRPTLPLIRQTYDKANRPQVQKTDFADQLVTIKSPKKIIRKNLNFNPFLELDVHARQVCSAELMC